VDPDELAAFGADVLAALGVPGADARLVAESLGAAEIRVPGEPEARSEARSEARHRSTGITLPAKTIAGLGDLAAECGVPFPFDHPEGNR
jgi:LDH2 family malate/lactate/ureidoglycolate dehydrogenase